MSKIFLCGITQNKASEINDLTKDIYSYFDGLIWVDHQSYDGTKELLEKRKGGGEIITLPFIKDHGWSMHAILNSSKLAPYDFIFWRDSDELINVDFAENIHNFCSQLAQNKVNSVFSYGKLLIMRFFPDQYIIGTPHWQVVNLKDKKIELSQIEEFKDSKTYAWNNRYTNRPKDHWIDHFVKYYIYPLSNNLWLGRDGNLQEYSFYENIRRNFIVYWTRELNQELSVEGIKSYILTHNLNNILKDFFSLEQCLNNFYRYYVLKHDVEVISKDSCQNIKIKIE